MRSRLPVYGALVYVVVCWGLNNVLVKSAIASFDPMAFAALRFLIMTPLAFGLVYAMGERIRIDWRDLPTLLLCGACGFGIYQYLWMLGLAHTSAFAVALFGATAPIFTLVLVAITGHEAVPGRRWLGASIALLGIAVFEGAFAGHATFRIGDLLALISSVVFAGYTVIAARLIARYSPAAIVAIAMTVGTAMILPYGLPRLLHVDLAHLGWRVWGTFVFAVLFPIVLTWPVWNYGIAKIGAARVSLFAFLSPIVAGIASVPILGQHFEQHQILGAGICIAGMGLSMSIGQLSRTEILAEQSLPIER